MHLAVQHAKLRKICMSNRQKRIIDCLHVFFVWLDLQFKIFFLNLHPKNGLTDGVTVALQFLELSVQVRILVGQLLQIANPCIKT